MEQQTETEQKRPNRVVIQVVLIVLGLLIFIGYFFFSLLAYMDYSREDIATLTAARWRSMIYGILLLAARVALFCRDAHGEKDKKPYQIGTWILQGIYVVLCVLFVILLLWLTKGQYTRETIHHFTDFKAVLVFLAFSQGMLQRIFHNGYELLHAWKQKLSVNCGPYLFRIVVYTLILYWACRGWCYTFVQWVREFSNMVGI